MTNYKRMQHDKEFCAWLLANTTECRDLEEWMQWLDREQVTLVAELPRQENAPLTCDGCEHLYQKCNGSIKCENCSRGTILPDRYEPKGEKPCLK